MTERSNRYSAFQFAKLTATNRRLIVLTGILFLCGSMQAASEPQCMPVLAFKDTRLSDVRNHERIWTGTLIVDAKTCTTRTGKFDLAIVRLIEHGPDLEFIESFDWKPGEITVLIKLHETEAPFSYRIVQVTPCLCR